MEFAANGELGSYLKKYGCLSEDRAHTWAYQVLNALNYLHEEMFTAHRDIKASLKSPITQWCYHSKWFLSKCLTFKFSSLDR